MSVASSSPRFRFTGIFIPVEVMEIDELTLFEERLLSIIDSLYCRDHGGCFASNEYLAQRMKGSKINTVVKALSKLRKLGLIIDVSFNGRQRIIRSCIGKVIHQSQSQSACDLNPSLGVIKIPVSMGQKSHSTPPCPYIDIKDDNKEEREELSAPPPPPKNKKADKKIEIPKTAYRENIFLTSSEHQKLLAQYGQEKLEWMLDYMEAKKGSKDYAYKSDYHVLLPSNWVNQAYEEHKNVKGTPLKSQVKEDSMLAHKVWDRYKMRIEKDISLSANYLEFINGYNAPSVVLEFGSKDFRIKCLEQLRNRRLKTEGF